MSMQLCCVDPPKQDAQPTAPFFLPPSDIELMKKELEKIDALMKEVDAGNATEKTYEELKTAVEVLNEIILSLDNSKGIGFKSQLINRKKIYFFKIH